MINQWTMRNGLTSLWSEQDGGWDGGIGRVGEGREGEPGLVCKMKKKAFKSKGK